MTNSPTAPLLWGPPVAVPRCARWSVQRRLQDLDIPSACPADGSLRVEANHAVALLQVCCVVRRALWSRAEALDWLERCWETQNSYSINHQSSRPINLRSNFHDRSSPGSCLR